MASNPLLSFTTPFSKKINKSYRIPKLPKNIEAAVIQPEKTNFEEILPSSNEIVPKNDEILPKVNEKKITDYEVQKFLADIDLKLDKVCQLNSNPQSKRNTNLHKRKSNSYETPLIISSEKCLENHVLKLLNSANVPAKSTANIHVIPKRVSEATNCIKNQHTVQITMPQNFSLQLKSSLMIIEKDMKLTVHNPKSFAQEAPFWIPAKCQGKIDHSMISEQNLKKGQGCHAQEDHKGHAQNGHDQKGLVQEGYTHEGLVQKYHAQEGHAQENHDQKGHAQNGQVIEGYAQEGQAQESQAQNGHSQKGFVREGYAHEGHVQKDHALEAHAQNGHAKKGLVQEGYAHECHTQKGQVIEGYTQEGHAQNCHAQKGLVQEGFAHEGHSHEDHALEAHAQESFDEEGLSDLVEENRPYEVVEDTIMSTDKICLTILEEIVSKIPIDNKERDGKFLSHFLE